VFLGENHLIKKILLFNKYVAFVIKNVYLLASTYHIGDLCLMILFRCVIRV